MKIHTLIESPCRVDKKNDVLKKIYSDSDFCPKKPKNSAKKRLFKGRTIKITKMKKIIFARSRQYLGWSMGGGGSMWCPRKHHN
jgi:hypothetical protein